MNTKVRLSSGGPGSRGSQGSPRASISRNLENQDTQAKSQIIKSASLKSTSPHQNVNSRELNVQQNPMFSK